MFTTLFGGAAIFGTIGLVWDKIKFILSRISSIFIVSIKIDGQLPKAMEVYLSINFKKSPFQPLAFSTTRDYIKSIQKRRLIGFEEINLKDKALFWKKWKPLVFSKSNDDKKEYIQNEASISFIRGTFKIDSLIINAIDLLNEKVIKNDRSYRFAIYSHFSEQSNNKSQMTGTASIAPAIMDTEIFLGNKRILKYKINDIGEDEDKQKDLNILAFPKEIDSLIEEMKRWKDSEKWYKERCVPWKRGWLIWGEAGTGKTSLAKGIAQLLDLPIHTFDLSGMSNQNFSYEWSNMLNTTPCIALIEDIDAIFQGRQNVRINNHQSDLLTFDCFLNCIDGIKNTDGLFLIITTNKIDLLDDALGKPRTDKEQNGTYISTRPGRIDRAFQLKRLDKDCRIKIANRILIDCSDLIHQIVEKGNGDTGAQFQERCTQIALKNFWDKKN